ncbi:MAG TPA: hypothetical protein VJ891_01920 [Casimicrobiaceae bacterium]|nr:hypothetical protein [Casimicrobiaceae bacterium]
MRTCRSRSEAWDYVFNKVDAAPFQAALKSSGFYAQAQQQFGPEAFALLTKYTGPVG